MAKQKLRICSQCDKEELTFSSSLLCMDCFQENKKLVTINNNIKELECFGYKNINFIKVDNSGHNLFEVFNPICNHYFEMKMGNLRKLFKKNNELSCSICGSEKRIKKALQGYLDLYARDYDLGKYEDYRDAVRKQSERSYKKFKHVINPNNLKRGSNDYHLDHIKPIIQCFKEDLSVEECSHYSNLQMLYCSANLSKGKK